MASQAELELGERRPLKDKITEDVEMVNVSLK
jgi:hypothetical protein